MSGRVRLVERGRGDGAAVGRLTSLQKQNQDFESELSSLYTSVNTAGNLRGIASSQLMVEEFMNTYADNPNFTPTSPAYTNVIKMKNQLKQKIILKKEDYPVLK